MFVFPYLQLACKAICTSLTTQAVLNVLINITVNLELGSTLEYTYTGLILLILF